MNDEQKRKLASIPEKEPEKPKKVVKRINTNISLVTDEQLETFNKNIIEVGETISEYVTHNKEVLESINKTVAKSIEENAKLLSKSTQAMAALAITNNKGQIASNEKTIAEIKKGLESLDLTKVTITNPTKTDDLAKSKDFKGLEKAIVEVSQRINDLTESLKPNQQPDEFLPIRRVRKIGNKLVFDDEAWRASGGGGGSSSGGTTQIVDSSGNAVTVTGNKLDVNATVTSSGGAILDGVDNNIKSTVLDYTNSNPVAVRLTDTNGDYIAAGAGTQYTEGDTDATITGTAIMFESNTGTNAISTVNSTTPLPVTLANTGANATAIKVDGSAVTQPISVATIPSHDVTNAGTFATQATLQTGTNVVGKVGIDQTTPGTTNAVSATNLPTTVDTNSGNKSASTLRVVLATDQPALTNKLLVTPDANSAVNLAQLAGNTISSGVGTSGTGTLRVVGANNEGKTIVSKGGSASSSGDNTLVAAGTNKLKVFSYTFTTTSTTALTVKVTDGASGTVLWQALLQAPTSVNVGATATVTPPSYLFATSSATALILNLSSANAVHYSLSYYDEA